MKNFLFLCGPNGIGKTTICKELVRRLPGSAYVDSDTCRIMNPFILNDETIPTISKNISDLLRNYLNCPVVNTVIFSYGFHGRRKEVFLNILDALSDIHYNFIPFLLWCSEAENQRRMTADRRDLTRIQHALAESRNAFAHINFPKIDITDLSVSSATSLILEQACL